MEFFVFFGVILLGTLAIMKIAPKLAIGVIVTLVSLAVVAVYVKAGVFFAQLINQ